MISIAQRLQELGVVASESQSKRKREDQAESRGTKTRVESRPEQKTGKKTCYACSKEGYIAKDCPDRKDRAKTWEPLKNKF